MAEDLGYMFRSTSVGLALICGGRFSFDDIR